jgi:ubiquinone/menaquinone biosynthesis C-methylase UbiE
MADHASADGGLLANTGESMPVPLAGTFDDQAPRYDERAGLPSNVGELIARAIVQQEGVETGDLVVELGAGTGEIGVHISCMPVRYVGLDASAPMLRLFREKAVEELPSLIQADCDHTWPLGDGVAAVIFASRVIHLLDPEHVTREAFRVGRREGLLILGRLHRERDSIKERLRRKRRELLVDASLAPRNGAAGTRRAVALCQDAGATSLGSQIVAEWTAETSSAEVIANWESLTRMGSVSIDPETRAGILDEIRAWARVEIGDLDRAEVFREFYAIEVVRLP